MKHPFARLILKQIKLAASRPSPGLIYHDPNERNPSGHGWILDECLEVQHRSATYGIRLCQVHATAPVQVFVARIEDGEGTSNNYHVSFSSEHLDEYGLVAVTPSLKRCVNGTLNREPKRLGNYPAKVAGMASRYVIGQVDGKFLSRLFSIVDAKFDSLP
jgi:hypothetical protein